MKITGPELTAEFQRARSKWPFIHQTELAHGLPKMLLFAVGSRETDLTNEVGDSGHGHGVWQLDDRFHNPPGGFANFDRNVPLQCATAVAMLHTDLAITGGKVEEAAAIYNSGHPDRLSTTHHNYGIDVRERMQFLPGHTARVLVLTRRPAEEMAMDETELSARNDPGGHATGSSAPGQRRGACHV
jgi:hypothetical protein